MRARNKTNYTNGDRRSVTQLFVCKAMIWTDGCVRGTKLHMKGCVRQMYKDGEKKGKKYKGIA